MKTNTEQMDASLAFIWLAVAVFMTAVCQMSAHLSSRPGWLSRDAHHELHVCVEES